MKYFLEMAYKWPGYRFVVKPGNGKIILVSKIYKNKAQCRNIGAKFAKINRLGWREHKCEVKTTCQACSKRNVRTS